MHFKEWFCLDDRESFTIDPRIHPEDAQFYFGRDRVKEQLKGQISRAFIQPGVPKMVIYGSFGSGKTQTLYNLQHYLHETPPKSLEFKPKAVDVVLEMQSKSNNLDWHLQLMEALGRDAVAKWMDALFSKVSNFDQLLEQLMGDYNLTQVMKSFRGGGEIPLLAWRWLSANRLSATELQRLHVTRNLGEVGSGDMVNALVGLGRLAEQNGEKLIFFMDEAEQFNNIRNPDAVESTHSYIRKLAEPWNSSAGFVISAYSLTLDDTPAIMTRSDVVTRIKASNYVEIPPLSSVEDVRRFLSQLLGEFIDQKAAETRIQTEGLGVALETYPLNADAFDLICEYASQDPTKALPRNIINTLNECAISAWDADKPTIEDDTVNDIAPLVFG